MVFIIYLMIIKSIIKRNKSKKEILIPNMESYPTYESRFLSLSSVAC